MNYFPALLSFSDKRILLVGGGEVATKKLNTLLEFSENITIIAPFFSSTMEQLIQKHNLNFQKREYITSDLEKIDIIIVATENISLQEKIYHQTREKKILFHCVDKVELCDFIFPSYIKEENLIIAISTYGISPAFSKYLKEYLQKCLPKNRSSFLKELKEYRQKLPKGKERMTFLKQKVKEFFSSEAL